MGYTLGRRVQGVTTPTGFQINPNVRFRLIEGEAVVLRQEEGEVLVLNEVASRILWLASEQTPRTEIVRRLFEEFEVDESRLTHDVTSFLEEMSLEGILLELEGEG